MTGPLEPPIQLVPERVHALVVGIETYTVSHDWDLPGARRDAVRFTDWLTGTVGVPAENVRLLLSPPARACASPWRITHPHRAATMDNVLHAVFTELPACDGDLLWIYWAGHGYIDTGDRLLLPYQDATRSLTHHFNLGSALRWWRSERVRRGRFPYQIAITDACRIEATGQSRLNFGSVDYGGHKTLPDRQQLVLYASRPGELAENMAERGAGHFTDTLMKRLAGKQLADAVWGLEDTARAVAADFSLARNSGLAWQHPEFVFERGWDGSPIFGHHWTAVSQPVGTHCLDQQAWQELSGVLRGLELPPYTYDAYRWAFEISGCVPPATRRLPATDLMDIARDLDQRQGGVRRVPLVLPFVRHLAGWSSDSKWAADADAWVDATVARTGAAPVPPAPRTPEEKRALHIRLAADTQNDDRFWVRMWIHQTGGGFESLWESDRTLCLDEVRDRLAQEINAMAAAGDRHHTGITRIEFDVPFALLGEEFERWKLPIGRPNRPPRELGHDYEVVLRCTDERVGVPAESWRRKWKWLKTHGGQSAEAVRYVRDKDINTTLHLVLKKDAPPVCVIAEVSDTRVMEALDAVLDAGVPIAVWPRRQTYPGAEGMENTLTDLDDVRKLPKAVHDNRLPPYDRPLALLWDNPDRIPDNRFAVMAYGEQERRNDA
ncbi:VMAP-C domain-containing protein [Streptomyces sp. NPDC001680]